MKKRFYTLFRFFHHRIWNVIIYAVLIFLFIGNNLSYNNIDEKDHTSTFDVDQGLSDEEWLSAWQSKCLDEIVVDIIHETGAENTKVFESNN